MFVRNDMDYGTLECWASNSIGKQEHPCQFHVVRGGPPNPPKGCVIKNITYSGKIIFFKAFQNSWNHFKVLFQMNRTRFKN